MKKIELEMIGAIAAQRNWQSGNTTVTTVKSEQFWLEVEVYLHGHKIAQISGTHVALSDAGWQTVTTKSRLNAIASAFGVMGVYQKDFTWHFDDGTPFENWKAQSVRGEVAA